MGDTSLKFGPNWLRVLSHGGTSSPPSSPGPGKFKNRMSMDLNNDPEDLMFGMSITQLAEHRYGREEMLALFSKATPCPEELQNLGQLGLDDGEQPLAFQPITAEEQRIWQRCVNSESVMRGIGRASTNGIGRGRGGSVERGRGRGRGAVATYYIRGMSYEEEIDIRGVQRENGPPGLGGGRGKTSYERSQSATDARAWAERGQAGPPEEPGPPGSPSKELNRSTNTINWRSRKEEGDRWKGLGENARWGGTRPTWREKELEAEWDEMRGVAPSGNKSSRLPWDEREKENSRRPWEEDKLPEWATENDEEKEGSFDAAGAFHAPGYSDDEQTTVLKEDLKDILNESEQLKINSTTIAFQENIGRSNAVNIKSEDEHVHLSSHHDNLSSSSPLMNGMIPEENNSMLSPNNQSNHFDLKLSNGEEENLQHMQSAADDLVAKLVEEEDSRIPPQLQQTLPPPAGFINHSKQAPEEQWYYTDPQGEIQGPFVSTEMALWYKSGYFKSDLLLRRQCDDKFAQLGHLTRVFGRVPFLPGPTVPPLKVSELQKALAERERYEVLQAYQMESQLHQQKVSLRNQQVLGQLQTLDGWSTFSPSHQQQLFMQHMQHFPPIVPPTVPTILQNTSTPSTLPPSSPTPVTGNMSTISSGLTRSFNNLPRGLSHGASSSSLQPQTQDPIQAFVAQMTHPPVTTAELSIPQSSPVSSNLVGEGPLQKLLLQLQRNSGSNVSHNTTGHVSSSIIPNGNLNHAPHEVSFPTDDQEPLDPIQSLMSQFSKFKAPGSTDMFNKSEKEFNGERQKQIGDETIRATEQKKHEEERMRLQEIRLQEERLLEEEKRKELEEKNQRLEQELAKIQMEQKRKMDEVNKKNEQRQQEQKISSELKKEEEQRKTKAKQRSEDAKKRDEARKKDDLKKLEEQRKAEFIRRKEDVKQKAEEERLLEEKRRKEIKKKKEEKLETQKVEESNRPVVTIFEEFIKPKILPPVWNSKPGPEVTSSPSLAEIQKVQEQKQKKEKEAETQKELKRLKEMQRKLNEEKKQKESTIKWASKSNQNAKKGILSSGLVQPPVKSLLEIQKEEEKELKRQLEKEQSERAVAISQLTRGQASVWGSSSQSKSWASKASTGVPMGTPPQNQNWMASPSTAWSAVAGNAAATDQSGGFWDNPKSANVSNKSPSPKKPAGVQVQTPKSTTLPSTAKATKKRAKDDMENGKKSTSDTVSAADKLTQWSMSALGPFTVNSSLDIPTFLSLMVSLESPDDLGDYVKYYLGDSKGVKEFIKQYLEKRSKVRNSRRGQHYEDDIHAPAPAINPGSSQEFQEVKSKVKKGKKKMQKMDSGIMPFKLSANN